MTSPRAESLTMAILMNGALDMAPYSWAPGSSAALSESLEDHADQVARGMSLGIARDGHAAARGEYRRPLGHGLGGVVGALGVDVRSECGHEAFRRVVVEDHHGGHRLEGCHELGTLGDRHDGAPRTLETGHRAVGVDADHQDIAERPRVEQIEHMAHMEEIEASVGQDEPLAFDAAARGQARGLLKAEQRRHRLPATRAAPA